MKRRTIVTLFCAAALLGGCDKSGSSSEDGSDSESPAEVAAVKRAVIHLVRAVETDNKPRFWRGVYVPDENRQMIEAMLEWASAMVQFEAEFEQAYGQRPWDYGLPLKRPFDVGAPSGELDDKLLVRIRHDGTAVALVPMEGEPVELVKMYGVWLVDFSQGISPERKATVLRVAPKVTKAFNAARANIGKNGHNARGVLMGLQRSMPQPRRPSPRGK